MRGRPQWSIKDPLALRYFQLREEEYFILRMLDGQTSIDEIQARFAAAGSLPGGWSPSDCRPFWAGCTRKD